MKHKRSAMKATSCEAGRGSSSYHHRSPDPKHGKNAGGLVGQDEIGRKEPKARSSAGFDTTFHAPTYRLRAGL